MVIGIIQARMGSTRFEGKVLKEVNGIPLLRYQIDRLRKSRLLDKIVVATTTLDKDAVIEDFCKKNGVECFKGSEKDVLDRYYQCAKKYGAETVVRLTADCPLSDPVVVDNVITLFKNTKADFAANTVPHDNNKFPDGCDVEVFSWQALERAHREVSDPHDREHVTFYFWRYNKDFATVRLDNKKDYSGYRITVDYPEDFEVIEFIIQELEKNKIFGHLDDIVAILDRNPKVKAKNAMYYPGIGWKRPQDDVVIQK
jgi:spore coat polysaccharide biosynthesis protein SpsF